MEDAAVTPASEFRRVREQGELVTLPITGRTVRIRTVKPAALLRLGKIPDPLSELAMRVMFGPMSQKEYNKFFGPQERREHALEVTESLRIVCTAALIEPRIVDNPQADDEISIDDLEDVEQRFIFDLALLTAYELSRFRHQQTAGLEPVAAGESDAPEAERASGD